jgi:membrane protein
MTFNEWNDKDPFRQSAVIAYYAIFSIPGLCLIISISGYFFGNENVNQNILEPISSTGGMSKHRSNQSNSYQINRSITGDR